MPAGNQTGSYTTPIYVRQNRVDPRYARINIIDAGLNSWYNALALQLNKRMAHGVYRIRLLHLVACDR